MNNSELSTGLMATGIVVGVACVYAFRNELKLNVVVEKITENKDKLDEMIRDLVELGREVIIKLYNFFRNIVIKWFSLDKKPHLNY